MNRPTGAPQRRICRVNVGCPADAPTGRSRQNSFRIFLGAAHWLLKGCLHTHQPARRGLNSQQTADAYGDRGYDFIAFTTTDYLLKSKEDHIYENVDSEMILSPGSNSPCFIAVFSIFSRHRGRAETLPSETTGEYNFLAGRS